LGPAATGDSVRYVSTRGDAPALAFDDVVLAGLAADGGLYVPDTWPRIDADAIRDLASLPYPALTSGILGLFAGGAMPDAERDDLISAAYAGFEGVPDVAPLKPLGGNQWLLELFHGPTLAFKDYALQVLGRLFERVLTRRGERVTIIGATSGDTGSAAIEACRDRPSIEIFILHPKGRVSEVQRRQMTTVTAANVHNIAVEGTFDDCQDLVKALFNDPRCRERFRLSAVNSINWARIAAQVAYFAHAALALGTAERPVTFAVPTGNFGNVFAGYVARRIGLPVGSLIIGSNRNDILTRFFATGRMETGAVVPTLSPSMDIQISSNFERYLFDLFDRRGDRVALTMADFRRTGIFAVEDHLWRQASDAFRAARFDDEETKDMIAKHHRQTGELIDPHTAVGLAAAQRWAGDGSGPTVTIATAHPAKFPDAVAAATGIRPALPERLGDLFDRPEHFAVLPPDQPAISRFIADRLAERGVRP
jgi:threonine synthase